MTAQIVQFQNKPNSPVTLPPTLAVLIGEGSKSPAQWEGDWYTHEGQWKFQPRYSSSDYRFDPSTVPEPVRQGAKQTLEFLESHMAPASEQELRDWLLEVALVSGHKASDGQEIWEARYAIYAQHLDDIPRDILRHAVNEHIKASVFFPKVSELRDRAGPMLRERRKQIERFRELLGMGKREPGMFESLGDKLRMR